MPIAADRSDLPPAAPSGGRPQDPDPDVIRPILYAWYADYLDRGEDSREFAVAGTRFRASWAGGCARERSYSILQHDAEIELERMLNLKPDQAKAEFGDADQLEVAIEGARKRIQSLASTNPPGLAEAWRFGIGTAVHDMLQAQVQRAYPNAQIEVRVDLRPDMNGSASADIVIRERRLLTPFEVERKAARTIPGYVDTNDEAKATLRKGIEAEPQPWVTVVELKSINGFGFKMAAIPFRGPAEGPRHGAIIQASLQAVGLDADRLVLGYFSLENLSKDVAERNKVAEDIGPFAAQWTFWPDEFEPIARQEHKRVAAILDMVDAGKLPPRAIEDSEVPKAARITDPSKGLWTVTDPEGRVVQTGKTWMCGYCWQRDRCISDGPT